MSADKKSSHAERVRRGGMARRSLGSARYQGRQARARQRRRAPGGGYGLRFPDQQRRPAGDDLALDRLQGHEYPPSEEPEASRNQPRGAGRHTREDAPSRQSSTATPISQRSRTTTTTSGWRFDARSRRVQVALEPVVSPPTTTTRPLTDAEKPSARPTRRSSPRRGRTARGSAATPTVTQTRRVLTTTYTRDEAGTNHAVDDQPKTRRRRPAPSRRPRSANARSSPVRSSPYASATCRTSATR